MPIKLSDNVLRLEPVKKLLASEKSLTEVQAPTGDQAEGMPAVQEILALFREYQGILKGYADLIHFDSERTATIIKGFIISDQ